MRRYRSVNLSMSTVFAQYKSVGIACNNSQLILKIVPVVHEFCVPVLTKHGVCIHHHCKLLIAQQALLKKKKKKKKRKSFHFRKKSCHTYAVILCRRMTCTSHICVYVYVCMYVCICRYVCMYVCICTWMRMCVCI